MAKHAHRIMLVNKKMWRCTLPGCSFFIYVGLQHILPGKQVVCWECGEEFTFEDLKDEMPKCADCKSLLAGGPSDEEVGTEIERRLTLSKYGVKDESELTEEQRRILRQFQLLPPSQEELQKTKSEWEEKKKQSAEENEELKKIMLREKMWKDMFGKS